MDKKILHKNLTGLSTFSDVELPSFCYEPNKDWILFGEDDKYPEYLLYLFNKSPKHGSLLLNKVNYILGSGINPISENAKAEQWAKKVNKYGETLNSLIKKAIIDIELFGGFYWQVIRDRVGALAEIYHVSFDKIRVSKDRNYFLYKNEWGFSWKSVREKPIIFKKFNPDDPSGTQIFAYKEYNPTSDIYALPHYIRCMNAIETDIEISKYNLSAIQNGMFPSKLIQFFGGDPGPEGRDALAETLKESHSGSEQAGKFVLVFNKGREEEIKIDDLSATELDKHFQLLNDSVSEEIFKGHMITSPLLFGEQTVGKLGGSTEIENSYEIFKNTYANTKQRNVEAVINYFSELFGIPVEWQIEDVKPIGFKLDNQALIQVAPREWLLDQLGIDRSQYPEEAAVTKTSTTNTPIQASKNFSDEEIASMFDEVGESREKFTTTFSMPLKSNNLAEYEISSYQKFAYTPTNIEVNILDLIKKDKRISVDTIAEVLGVSKDIIGYRIANLIKRGLLDQKDTKVGEDRVVERVLTEPIKDITEKEPETADIVLRYSYEKRPEADGGDIIPGTRELCRRLVSSDKYYSRSDIEQISARLGYSVFDRCGGFWNDGGDIKYHCRHYWKVNIVLRKNK